MKPIYIWLVILTLIVLPFMWVNCEMCHRNVVLQEQVDQMQTQLDSIKIIELVKTVEIKVVK